jgi:hypothetical protein
LQSLTEPRAWFGVAALSAEWGGCVVGVADGLPPVVECAFPGGAGEGARPPAGLKGAARAAARATRVALGPGTRVTRVVYQATQQRAWLCAGEWTPAGWSEGALPYGLDGGVARLADAVMTTSGRGSSLRGCVGRDLAWTLPPDVAPLQVGDGWTEGLAEALPALLEGVTPFAAPDPVSRWATLPTRLVRSSNGAPHPGGDVAVRVGLPADPARPVVTTARYLVWEAGEPVLYATVSADGVPEDGVALAGPPVPAGAVIGAVVEVVAGAPEERLAVWSVR